MRESSAWKVIERVAAYGIAAAGLVWVFHDVDGAALVRSVVGLDWRWAALGVFIDVLSYASQGYRWNLLLKPLGGIGTFRAIRAVYAGLFINEVLPLRLGEIARGLIVSFWMSKDVVTVIPSMALERLFDGIWLAAGLGLTAIFVRLPPSLLKAGDIFGVVMLGLTAIFIALAVRKTKPGAAAPASGSSLLHRLLSIPRRLAGGFRSIGITRYSVAAFFISLLLVSAQTLSFWLIMKACGLGQSFWIGAAVSLIVRFGTALPNAPANIGSYQLFCVLGLTLFGVEKAAAAGFSIVVFILLSFPLWIIGAVALGQSGLTIAAIKSRLKALRTRP